MKKLFALLLISIAAAAFYKSYGDSILAKKSLTAESGRRGVVFHDRLRATAGYHLLDHYIHSPRCALIDRPGAEDFILPGSLCKILPDGSYISQFNEGLTYWQPNGLIGWNQDDLLHNDIFINEKHATIFAPAHEVLKEKGEEKNTYFDSIVGYNFSGEKIFSWSLKENRSALEALIHRRLKRILENDQFFQYAHFNSVQELSENPLSAKINAFRIGNILVNDFRNGIIFVIDRETKEIVWHYFPEDGVFAHSVRLNDDGEIVFLNNLKREAGAKGSTHSSIDFLDPVTKSITHSITVDPKEGFSTSYWGSLQLLPGNRFLVTNSLAGSAFEIDRDGRIYWEWINPENEGNRIKPIYRVQLIEKGAVDKLLTVWKSP